MYGLRQMLRGSMQAIFKDLKARKVKRVTPARPEPLAQLVPRAKSVLPVLKALRVKRATLAIPVL